jgi:hypothetical protein
MLDRAIKLDGAIKMRQGRTYPVVVEDGETLAKGPYLAETFSGAHRGQLRHCRGVSRRNIFPLFISPQGTIP